MLKTTTSLIEGFHIIQWLGIVTGVDLYMVGGLIGEGFLKQNDLFASASKRALERMESSASALGANAIIGISSSVAVVLQGQIEVTMIGTAVRVEGISSKGEESSIGREFTIPVRKTNIRNPIYARNIKLRERSGEIGICFTYYDERPLRALLADITLCSIFGEYKINGDYYCEFQKYQSNIYQTEFMVKDIPSHIRGMITHADVLIKECVFDDELLRIESLDLLSIEEVEEKMVDASDDELLRIESSDLPSIEEVEDTMVEQKADGLDNSNSDNMSLFEELVKLNTSKEMLEYVETHKDSISSAVVDELTKKLQERWIYERTYGVRKDRTIKEIESILGVD